MLNVPTNFQRPSPIGGGTICEEQIQKLGKPDKTACLSFRNRERNWSER